MTLGTINLFFLLVFLFGYSPLSLLFLFISWLILTGITLHLIFLATSEDDYHLKFKREGAKEESLASKKPLEQINEFVGPRIILKAFLAVYKVLLTLKCEY